MSEQHETIIRFKDGITRQMRSGVERITFRMGYRTFSNSVILCNDERTQSIEGTVNKIVHTTLTRCPFVYFRQYKWDSLQDVLDNIRKYYPEIGVHDPITVVFYRVNIPIKGE